MTSDDGVLAAVVETVRTLWENGEPTTPAYLQRRFHDAAIRLDDALIVEASRWVPYRPEPR